MLAYYINSSQLVDKNTLNMQETFVVSMFENGWD